MIARIAELRGDVLPADAFGSGCDLVVVHAALNVPVEIEGVATMPIAAIAVNPANRTVLGIGLSITRMDARSAARALRMALNRLPVSSATAASDGPLRIAIDTLPGTDWMELRTVLAEAGAVIVGETRALPRRDVAAKYLGRKVGGIEVRPRLTMKHPAHRTPYLASGQSCMTMQEVFAFVTVRTVPTVRPVASGQAASHLIRSLEHWLGSTSDA